MSAVGAVASLVPMIVVASMRRIEARIHRQLVDAQAFTAESAIELPLSRSFERSRLQGLIDGGAVRLTANSRHFLDADGWTKYQSHRRRRALFALAIIVAILGVGFAVSFTMR